MDLDEILGRVAELRRLGRRDEALAELDAALATGRGEAQVLFQRANLLTELGRREEALAALDAVIAADPRHLGAHNNRGIALLAGGRAEEAIASLQAATRLQPDEPRAHSNLGEALVRAGRSADALASFDAALALRPDYPHARLNRSLALLSLGRFAAGWPAYEARWAAPREIGGAAGELPPALLARLSHQARREELIGRQVLLVAEQGVGDVIMFASMIPDALRDAAGAMLLCAPRLQRLFAASFPALPTLASGRIPDADVTLALGSLGALYRTARSDFPGRPYLTASSAVRARWAARLGPRRGLRVGLAWRGGLEHNRRAERSLDLAQLAPLFEVPGCEFVSLQHGEVGAEIDALERSGRAVRSFDPADLADFEDLAALVQGLDVVVTVQTAVAHLTGALGVPGLVMLPSAPEWRYAMEPSSMPWYASLELVRQPTPGDWPAVVGEIARRLAGRRPSGESG